LKGFTWRSGYQFSKLRLAIGVPQRFCSLFLCNLASKSSGNPSIIPHSTESRSVDCFHFALIAGSDSRTLGEIYRQRNKIAVVEPRGWLNDGDSGSGSTDQADHAVWRQLVGVLLNCMWKPIFFPRG
jgi:hypothetical protein